MFPTTLHALVAMTLCNLYWWCFFLVCSVHILATAIVTWTVWWCVAVVLVVEVVAALVGIVLVALAHIYTGDTFRNLYCVVVVVGAVTYNT